MTRRALLGAALAAPMLASAQAANKPKKDVLLEHLAKEMALTYKRGKNRWRAEHSRAMASDLRLWALHASTTDFDGALRSALKAKIAKEGRASIVDAPLDHSRMARELAALGIDMGDLPMSSADPAAARAFRENLLTDFVAGRVSLADQLRVAADNGEAAAASLQQREGVNLIRMQGSVDAQCRLLAWNVLFAESLMIFICLSIVAVEACPAASVFYMSMRLTEWWAGC